MPPHIAMAEQQRFWVPHSEGENERERVPAAVPQAPASAAFAVSEATAKAVPAEREAMLHGKANPARRASIGTGRRAPASRTGPGPPAPPEQGHRSPAPHSCQCSAGPQAFLPVQPAHL